MKRRIRRVFGKRWLRRLFILSLFSTSVIILRRVKQHGLHFRVFSTFNLERKELKKEITISSNNVDATENWERLKFMKQRHIVKQTKNATFEIFSDKARTINFAGNSSENKGVNVHLWKGLCCTKVNSLRQYPLFPVLPRERSVRRTINSGPLGTWYGQRIMGYLYPPRSGHYLFNLNAHVFAEFWLSKGQNINDVRLEAKVAQENRRNSFSPFIGRTSRKLHLENSRRYFFDVLHVMNGGMMGRDHVNITWQVPGSDKFTEINEAFLSPVLKEYKSSNSNHESTGDELWKAPSIADTEINDVDAGQDDEDYETSEIPNRNIRLSAKFTFYFGEDFDVDSNYNRSYFNELSDASEELLSSLPSCPTEQVNSTAKQMKQFEGVWKTKFNSIFPNDVTKQFVCIGGKRKEDCEGNDVVTEQEAITTLQTLMEKVDEKYTGKFTLRAVVNIEKKHDTTVGYRYFFDLVFRNNERNEMVRLSDFVYTVKNSSVLCKPKSVTWKRNVTINVVLTVKGQGDWALHFIREMSRICRETNDGDVNIIIVDYGSEGFDVEKALRRSSLTKFKVLKRSGAFHKTEAIQSAVRTISDPRSIVLLYDLHLLTPTNLFHSVRKHTVEGKLTFNPVLFRLTYCGRPLTQTTQARGFWETFGFGIFGIFKSDWDRFGGMDVESFQHKWGGEDWDMIDRVLTVGLEVERLRMPGFYHFYHSKNGMWDDVS